MAIVELKLEQVKVGQELAQPITNMKGQQILPQGTIILKNHLVLFQKLGLDIIKINVYDDEVVSKGSKSLDPLEELKSRINWNPILEQEAELIKIALNYLQDKNE